MTVTDPVTTQAGLGFELGEELSLIQDEAKKFADDVLLPLATKHDREERIGDDVYRQMGELGFYQQPHTEQQQVFSAKEALESELQVLYERWETLEAEAE